LGFPTFCAAHGVEVNPTTRNRPAIDLKFIVNNEQASQVGDARIHHSPIHHPG